MEKIDKIWGNGEKFGENRENSGKMEKIWRKFGENREKIWGK